MISESISEYLNKISQNLKKKLLLLYGNLFLIIDMFYHLYIIEFSI